MMMLLVVVVMVAVVVVCGGGDKSNGGLLVVGGGDAPAPSNSELVINVELCDAGDNAAAAAAAAAAGDKASAANGVSNVLNSAIKATDGSSAESHSDAARGSSLSVGLSTGRFDAVDVTMLRSCSEPDLSCPSRLASPPTHKSLANSRKCSLTASISHNNMHNNVAAARIVSRSFSPAS